MARYLVTGGCGFIGSHLVDSLVADGHAVRVADDLSTPARATVPHAAELVRCDVRDPARVRAAAEGVDGCFHLAAVASVARCNEDWVGSHRTNLSATLTIFEAAVRQRFPVVYASSAAVYGDNPHVPLREDEPPRPLSAYGVDKAAAEMHARAAATVHGLSSIGLRFFNVYGPRQQPGSAYSGVISLFLDRLRRGAPLTVHGDGRQSRDFVHVADVAAALRLAMRRLELAPASPSASVCNVCTGIEVSILELAELLMRAAGRRVPIGHAPPRAGDVRRSVGSPRRAAEELGFASAVGIEAALHRLSAALAA